MSHAADDFAGMLVLHDRPGLDRDYFGPNGHVFFNVDGAVNDVVPNRRIVGPVYDVYLYFDGPLQRRIAFIFRGRFQLVCLALLNPLIILKKDLRTLLLRPSRPYPQWHSLWWLWGRTHSYPREEACCSGRRHQVPRPRPRRKAAHLCRRRAREVGISLATKHGASGWVANIRTSIAPRKQANRWLDLTF